MGQFLKHYTYHVFDVALNLESWRRRPEHTFIATTYAVLFGVGLMIGTIYLFTGVLPYQVLKFYLRYHH